MRVCVSNPSSPVSHEHIPIHKAYNILHVSLCVIKKDESHTCLHSNNSSYQERTELYGSLTVSGVIALFMHFSLFFPSFHSLFPLFADHVIGHLIAICLPHGFIATDLITPSQLVPLLVSMFVLEMKHGLCAVRL